MKRSSSANHCTTFEGSTYQNKKKRNKKNTACFAADHLYDHRLPNGLSLTVWDGRMECHNKHPTRQGHAFYMHAVPNIYKMTLKSDWGSGNARACVDPSMTCGFAFELLSKSQRCIMHGVQSKLPENKGKSMTATKEQYKACMP